MKNRIIKFKCWDKVSKKIYDVATINTGYVQVINYVNIKNMGEIILKNRLELLELPRKIVEIMQYTGFKDNNKQEIYESNLIEYCKKGDIIRFSEVWFNQKNGSWYTQAGKLCDLLHQQKIGEIDNIKVVGNIFEDKKIIKEMGGLWEDKLKKYNIIN